MNYRKNLVVLTYINDEVKMDMMFEHLLKMLDVVDNHSTVFYLFKMLASVIQAHHVMVLTRLGKIFYSVFLQHVIV